MLFACRGATSRTGHLGAPTLATCACKCKLRTASATDCHFTLGAEMKSSMSSPPVARIASVLASPVDCTRECSSANCHITLHDIQCRTRKCNVRLTVHVAASQQRAELKNEKQRLQKAQAAGGVSGAGISCI